MDLTPKCAMFGVDLMTPCGKGLGLSLGEGKTHFSHLFSKFLFKTFRINYGIIGPKLCDMVTVDSNR